MSEPQKTKRREEEEALIERVLPKGDDYYDAFIDVLRAWHSREDEIRAALEQQGNQNSGRILLRIEAVLNDDERL